MFSSLSSPVLKTCVLSDIRQQTPVPCLHKIKGQIGHNFATGNVGYYATLETAPKRHLYT